MFYGVPPAPKDYDFDFDDGAAPPPPPVSRPDVPAKPAVVVGLQQARRQKGKSTVPPPMPGAPRPIERAPKQKSPPPQNRARAALPKPFDDGGATRSVQDAELMAAVRSAPGPGRVPGPFDAEPTRLGNVDARLLDENVIEEALATMPGDKFIASITEQNQLPFEDSADEATRMTSMDSIAAMGRAQPPAPSRDERTRLVDVRNDPNMTDVDWDLD